MSETRRQIGLEQEFFLVDRIGVIADRADEVLQGCHQLALKQGRRAENFAP